MAQLEDSASVAGDIAPLSRSFARALRAANRSPRTVETYLAAIDQLTAYLLAHGMPSDVCSITREYVEASVSELVDTRSASTASNRFRALVNALPIR